MTIEDFKNYVTWRGGFLDDYSFDGKRIEEKAIIEYKNSF